MWINQRLKVTFELRNAIRKVHFQAIISGKGEAHIEKRVTQDSNRSALAMQFSPNISWSPVTVETRLSNNGAMKN